jgi:hypothetical protein
MKRQHVIKLVAVSSLAFAGAALADVTFDPATGMGFVGKGDVQSAFGWNNATLQANADYLTFTYKSVQEYEAVCTWTTGEGTKGEQTHNVTHTRETGIDSDLSYEVRKVVQVSGFFLEGFASGTSATGSVPVVGGACPGNQGHDGVWTSVTAVGEGDSTSLTVSFGGDTRVLPWSP